MKNATVIVRHTILQQYQVDNFFATISNAIISLTEQILNQMEIIYSNREDENLYINKFGSKIRIDMIENMEIAKVTSRTV